jgi:histone H3/H4
MVSQNQKKWFTHTVLARFARKAGIKALEKSPFLHDQMEYHFAIAFEAVFPLLERYSRRNDPSVRPIDVTRALKELVGETYDTYMPDRPIKPCKLRKPVKNEKNKLLQNIIYYENQMDCLYIPKRTFKAIVGSNFYPLEAPLKWTQQAIDQFQLFLEKTFVSLLKDARVCAIHARRLTVKHTDIAMAEYLRRRTFFNYDDGERYYGSREFKRTDREPEDLNFLRGALVRAERARTR